MASPFGNSAGVAGRAAAGAVNSGPDLETIQTEALGFLSIAGDAKVRLTTAWSTLPAPTSSLLSIASRKGLVAAAGPDQLIIARTESVRKAFESPKNGDTDVRAFEPQLLIPMPMRISQLAFTADENYLVLSAENGGGLAVYEVQSLLQGSKNSAFELSTNGEPLRMLVPNPTPEKAELCAIVTNNGNLHMASLKERQISNVLRSQVSCISWSAKGKQLCAGLADGTIHQMTPEGDAKAEIPKPPSVGSCHVSSLTWLENNLFLAVHTTTNETPSASVYHIITREPPSNFTFQKINDPVDPFGSDKTPHHSILRLRDFPPDLQDLLIVASTASTEVGLLSRSKAPLTTDKPANSITGVFTHTELLDDTKRPTLPMTDSMDDSTPVGIALDLSSKDKVYKPIPSEEELEESPTPLPGLWVLTHEGILCSWWVVYTDSVMKGTSYSGLAIAEGAVPTSIPDQTTPAVSAAPFSSSNATAFGAPAAPAPAFGASTQLGQKQSPWGGSVSTPAANTGGAVFGASTFGNSPSSGAAFGKASPIGFGQSSQLGIRTSSPWATGGVAAPSFGQSGFSGFAKNSSNQSPFGAASPSPSSGGFSGFAKQGGFASIAAENRNGSSVFGSGSKLPSEPFGSGTGSNAFASKDNESTSNVFGSTPFKLESSFKADPSQAESNDQPPATTGSSLFGSDFSSLIGQQPRATTPPGKDEDMDTAEPTEQTPQAPPPSVFSTTANQESTTPTTTPAPGRFGFASSPAPGTSLFGQPTKLGQSGGLFGSGEQTPKPSSGIFGSAEQTPRQPTSTSNIFGQKKDEPIPSIEKSTEPETPKIKTEEDDRPFMSHVTSKESATMGESSLSATPSMPKTLFGNPLASSKQEAMAKTPNAANQSSSVFGKSASDKAAAEAKVADDAPLPPDFNTAPKTSIPEAPLPPDPTQPKSDLKVGSEALALDTSPLKASQNEVPSIPSGPEESDEGSDLGEDDESEGSGVDVAKDLSPTALGPAPTPGYTPQSSFGGVGGTTPATARAEQDRPRALFGEIGRNAPLFPRPNAGSPRSPSPVRNAATQRVFRMDATRSVSAPGMASQLLGTPKSQSVMGRHIVSSEKLANAEESFLQQHRKLKARQEAEETRPLIDEEDDEVQKVLASEVEGTLELDEFIAHSNVAPPAQDSIPSQVEAVYRDINSMIDTLGLNARAVKAFLKGHTENGKEGGRDKDDLEIPDDWVLCEVSELGDVLDNELYGDLEDGRVQDLDSKLDACQELSREMQRLRARQEDVKRIVMARLDPDQVQVARSLPLSAEQAAQQNELRREYGNFSKLLAQAEEALTLLKTRLAAMSGSSGRGSSNVPTVDAVIRTITKMTSMAEKRSGDIDVLETQMRKMRLGSVSREGSPMVTPQTKKSIMMTPNDSTPSRTFRHSLSGSVSLGPLARATPPRKKLSGFSREEKSDLMGKRARRQAVLAKFKSSVEKKGVSVWNMEDIE